MSGKESEITKITARLHEIAKKLEQTREKTARRPLLKEFYNLLAQADVAMDKKSQS